MRYAIAIDVGIRNLGVCVYDFITCKIVYWDNIPLMSGRYIPSNNVIYVREFVRRFHHYFNEIACLIVERQMRCNMRIIEALLQSTFYDVCVVINPKCVKMHYGTSKGEYRANKIAAVDWATSFVERNPGAFADSSCLAFNTKGAKKDDLADSLLLILYYLDTYSNQLSSE
jgi:hypothetical protein